MSKVYENYIESLEYLEEYYHEHVSSAGAYLGVVEPLESEYEESTCDSVLCEFEEYLTQLEMIENEEFEEYLKMLDAA